MRTSEVVLIGLIVIALLLFGFIHLLEYFGTRHAHRKP